MKLHYKLAKAFGYELIKRSNDPSLEFHLDDLITAYKIDLIIDVGANTGQFGMNCRKLGYQGEIHSFEPAKSVHAELLARSENDKDWHAHNKALGAQQSQAELKVATATDLSSFLEPSDYGKERFKKIDTAQTEMVNIDTLDNFLQTSIPDYKQRRIFLKMDTQGFDLQVFEGGLGSMDSVYCLLSEIAFLPIYDNMPRHIESLQTYEKQGFQVSGLYPITRNKETRALIEMDCVMVKV